MKLVFVTDNGFSKKNGVYYYSGANIQHYTTVTKHFDNITFIARDNSFDPSSNPISKKYRVHLVESITNGRNVLGNYIKINNILDNEIKNCDVVMCFGINGYLAYKKAKKYNKPIISYVGGCVYDTLKNMDSKFKKLSAPLLMLLIKRMVQNSSYVHYVDQYLIKRYPTSGKYLVCPSAKIDIDENALKCRIKKIQSQKGQLIIGLIGYTNNKIKGIDTAVKALKLLGKEYKLQVVGRGNHDWLINLAKSLNVENRVEFLGLLSGRDEIFRWLDSVDIYIQPSLTEGMPRATIEAMSRGCPVVSSNAGGLKTIINKKYQIEAGDFSELARKISLLGQSQDRMLEEALGNFEVAKKFDSNILNTKRNSFYNKIVNHIRFTSNNK